MWNPLIDLHEKIIAQGGFVNAHAHFDRAFSVTQEDFLNLQGVNSHLHEKWKLVDKFKSSSSEENYFNHIMRALKHMDNQGVKTCLSFIDCDPVAGSRALKAALKAKKIAQTDWGTNFLIACQTLKGVVDSIARKHFEQSLEYVDIIGGLPGADMEKEEQHIDVLFAAAKQTGKRVHVHVDQLNSAKEHETEMLVHKIIKWGLEGRVTAVHGISIAAHTKNKRNEIYAMCKDTGLSFVACPTAWIDARRNETLAPTHNAVTPIDEMIEKGIVVALGSDNICDVYKPFADGNMLTELRVLLEANHFYDQEELIKIATINGQKVLGLA